MLMTTTSRSNETTGPKHCAHCKKTIGLGRPRGLCHSCYNDLSIRLLYPILSKISQGHGLHNPRGILPPTPTTAIPGSPEKVRVLEERARQGYSLHRPGDLNYNTPSPAPESYPPHLSQETATESDLADDLDDLLDYGEV